MLMPLSEIVDKYGKPNGIIHIGANLMQERGQYLNFGLNNTIWVEANTNIYNNIKKLTNENVFNYAISDVDGKIYELYITNNNSLSSSILKLNKHKMHYPTIFETGSIKIESKRMDSLIIENKINILNYNFLNIDIQGAELLAIKGFGDLLNNIKYIYTEVYTNYLYENCALIGEIDEYLKAFGFLRMETNMTKFEWGEALYQRRQVRNLLEF